MADVPKRDWNEIVAASGGKSVFAPDSLIGRIKEWKDKRSEFTKRVNEIAKDEVEMKVMFEQLILDIRKHFAEAREDIWTADVGIEMNALKEGQFIINISEGQK